MARFLLVAAGMSIRILPVIAAALLAAACDGNPAAAPDAGAPETDAAATAARVYEHPLYDDPDECPDDPLFNCTPSLTLCPDGTATVLVTDIVNAGVYEETGAAIVTEWEVGDVPDRIEFEVREAGSVLVDDWQGWSWTLDDDADPLCGT